jgi:hypothetical protein
MSTEGGGPSTRRGRSRPRRARAFATSFGIVAGLLAAVALSGAALTTAQGPRVTDVQFDPQAAVTASGSRLILTTTQSLEDIAPAQVTVTPSADFTVDTSGRSVGVRFVLPLWDETAYTVRIDDVAGLGGGPTSTIEETFTTPPLEVFLLQRTAEGDTVFRTDLAGDAAEPVFTHPHIEDFRATAGHLVMSTLDEQQRSHLIVTDLDGAGERELPLPGEGLVTGLQGADRGNLIGYTFTDAAIGEGTGRESALFTASLSASQRDTDPTPIERTGGDSRVDDWRFVPDTDSVLMLTFDGALTLASPSGSPVSFGNAIAIDGMARGSAVAIIERVDGIVALDLATAKEQPLPATDPALGQAWSVVALPGEAGETLRVMSVFGGDGFTVDSTSAMVVDAAGAARAVFGVPLDDALLHTCVSPSGRYAAFLVAPDVVDNPYDGYLLPLPERVQTHVVSLEDGIERVALRGFDISWCRTAPRG